jgi:hypothetical protein
MMQITFGSFATVEDLLDNADLVGRPKTNRQAPGLT